MRIPFLDLARRFESLHDEALPAIERVLRSGRLLGGPETEAFEAEFAAYCAAALCRRGLVRHRRAEPDASRARSRTG